VTGFKSSSAYASEHEEFFCANEVLTKAGKHTLSPFCVTRYQISQNCSLEGLQKIFYNLLVRQIVREEFHRIAAVPHNNREALLDPFHARFERPMMSNERRRLVS